MTAAERIQDAGYEDVVILENYSYDDALVGVTDQGVLFMILIKWFPG